MHVICMVIEHFLVVCNEFNAFNRLNMKTLKYVLFYINNIAICVVLSFIQRCIKHEDDIKICNKKKL